VTKQNKTELRVTQWTLVKTGEPIFDESGWQISIDDESGGEYVKVQSNIEGKVAINPEEWPALRAAIDKAISECREDKSGGGE
jgi:uncharacterized FlaG/YvyC family protein